MSRFSFSGRSTAVEHVAVEKVGPSRSPSTLGFLNEGQNKLVELVRRAVVGVEGHVDG